MPAFSYFVFSLAAVARASDRTVSVADVVCALMLDVVVLKDNVVEKLEENDDPSPRPRVVR